MPSDTAIIFLVSLPFSPGNSSILDLWDFVTVLAALCISSPGHQALRRVFAPAAQTGGLLPVTTAVAFLMPAPGSPALL